MSEDLKHTDFDVFVEAKSTQKFPDDVFDTDFEKPVPDEDGREGHLSDTDERELEVTQKSLERILNEELQAMTVRIMRWPGAVQKYRDIRQELQEIQGLVFSEDGEVVEKYRE